MGRRADHVRHREGVGWARDPPLPREGASRAGPGEAEHPLPRRQDGDVLRRLREVRHRRARDSCWHPVRVFQSRDIRPSRHLHCRRGAHDPAERRGHVRNVRRGASEDQPEDPVHRNDRDALPPQGRTHMPAAKPLQRDIVLHRLEGADRQGIPLEARGEVREGRCEPRQPTRPRR